MRDRHIPHDLQSCRHCESIPAGVYRRHWKVEKKASAWHVISDGPDFMVRLPRQAHFATILAYHTAADGIPLQYRGPLYWEGDAEDPAEVFRDTRRSVEFLRVEYGCPPEALRLWLSGRRSVHTTLPARVFGAEGGHPQLPHIYAMMTGHLFPPSMTPSFDRSIYNASKGRMWRLPNRRRSDSGRYKVPISVRELLHKAYSELEPFSHCPRKGIFWLPEEDLSPCLGLVQLYQEMVAASERKRAVDHVPSQETSNGAGNIDLLFARCAFIRHCRDDAVTLSEPQWFAMISNVGRCADGSEAVHRLSAPYPGYSPQETDAKIAHALQGTGPHTCAHIQALGFAGCPARGCGVKAPIGLTRPHPHTDDLWSGLQTLPLRPYSGYRGLRYGRG